MTSAIKPTRKPAAHKLGGIAVVDQSGVWHDGTHFAFPPVDNLQTAWGMAHMLGVRQLWLTAGGVAAAGLPVGLPHGAAIVHPFLEHGRLATPRGQDHLTPWMSAWDGEHYVEVSIAPWDRGNPFHGLDFGPILAGEVLEFMEATGMMWRRSGAITSDAWLREHHRNTGVLVPVEYPDVALDANLEEDLHWHRAPVGSELKAHRCFGFDLNAMYLGAASSLRLPAGEMSHAHPGEMTDPVGATGPAVPGYWRFEDVWLTSPAAVYEACALTPDEGWWWASHHRGLEPWYRALRDARKKLLPFGPSPSLEAVKQVYRQGIGRFGSTRRSSAADPLYQPYWRHALQAEARTRFLRRLSTFTVEPVAVDVDCCYFLSSSRTPQQFAKRVGIPLGIEIGQFKVKSIGPGKAVRAALSDPDTHNVAGALRELVK